MSAIACPVRAAALARPEAIAIAFGTERWTYRRLDAEVGRFSALLSAHLVGVGDRVCVLSHNRPELVALWFALLRAGAALVPLNARLSAPELAVLVELAQPELSLAEETLLARLPGALALATPPESAEPAAGELELERVAAVLFTSGTTGRPKGAQLTVGNFLANATGSAERLGGSPDDRWLGSLSLFHVGGLAMAFRVACYGATLVLMPRFEADAACALIESERCTHASFVPTTLARLIELRANRPLGASLKAVLIGGGPVSANLIQRARALGVPALQTYGLTEACSQVCTEQLSGADGTTAGPALSGLEVRVVDGARRALPAGVAGELEVRGPTVMRGYLGGAGQGADADGWLQTRDWATLDAQGRVTIHARRTDLILTGGENVYPAELEAVLARHPAIRDAAVIGAPDETWGQVPVALVASRGAPVEGEELSAWCRAHLAGFKIPRRFVAVDEVPRNANGKIDRTALAQLAGLGRAPVSGGAHTSSSEGGR